MSMMYLTKAEKQILYEGLNVLMVDKMKVLNQTKSTPWMFPDPEEAREKLYNDMDDIDDLLDRLNSFM